jgi:hypothetical protein
MTPARRLGYQLLVPIGMGILKFFWSTCRIVRVEGAGPLENRLLSGRTAIVCYWHRHQLLCWSYLINLIQRGPKIGWLISASVDGQVPSDMAKRMGGGIVFRGSTTAGGAQAMRAMYKALTREQISIAATPDGPSGPVSVFKPGVIKLAQLAGVPLVPMAWAVKRALVLRTWDRFVVPRPFSRVVVAVGEPVEVPRDIDDAALERLQREMERRMQALYEKAREIIGA